MSAKPVVPRIQARIDIEQAVDHYAAEAGEGVALGFIDAVQAAFRRIGANPAGGSPRHAVEIDLPGLRCVALRKYPHLVFYVEQAAHIDVWRVLHGHRDVPASLRGQTTCDA